MRYLKSGVLRSGVVKPSLAFLTALIIVLILAGPLFSRSQSPADRATVVSSGPALQTGVSAALAAYRSRILHGITYDLQFDFPASLTDPVSAKEKLSFDWQDDPPGHDKDTAPLQIDFKETAANIKQLSVNGMGIPIDYQREHLLIARNYLQPGHNSIDIGFTAGDISLHRNGDFLYTLLVPDRARTVFPCFDQPDLKAVFTLSLTMLPGWTVLSNAPLRDSVIGGNSSVWHFLPSDTISTYLFSFAAGRFVQALRQEDGRAMHFYYRETDSSKLRMSLEPVFRIQADALKFMQDYTGIPFPFQKFDFVAIPDFQFGGMEHPGAIQYKAASLFLDPGATRDQLIARSNLLSHETAHMWFGGLVTMSWFNDVWMKEVFANFMADKISKITLPDGNYDLKFLTDHFPAAYGVDRTQGRHPIRQQLDNLQDAGSLYGNIIYHKAPIMMRQLERLMGSGAFREGLKDYLKRYAWRNASWPDLIKVLQGHTKADLQSWNYIWVGESGRPQFSYWLQTARGKISRFMINQRGEDGSRRVWPQLFEVALVYKDRIEELTVNMNAERVRLRAAEGKAAPLFILFNSSGQGYGLFPVDKHSIPRLITLKTPLMRAAAYINLYENMLNGHRINPLELLSLYRSCLAAEPEELNLNLLIDQLSSVYWRFIRPVQRDSLATGLEKDLWQAMQQVGSGNEKKLLFKAYSNIALSSESQDRLFSVWKTQQPPPGVQLSEDDYSSLAAALALRNYPGQQQILDGQLQRIQNKDRKERWLFLQPALSGDSAKRDAFFGSLQQAGSRKKEAWVLTALSYLHHPLRAAGSEKYLQKSLELLEEIQLTGDVFFPQGWLQASLGWYQSRTAAAVVRDFLQSHPGYNPKLKAKILQAADNLFRAERLMHQRAQ